ncbi:hypothetical protein XA68_14992 [Ophiocordyceps unilateralis]|uniref:DNA polymerase n=1 Tax=Ophiocordyceps unilateralis TaxID=268505 RepID=A0A2A9P7L0_OPHUN|nr:hypothetical protein XA68_14992 [Ophiocordyceps unilateralis]
MDLFRVRLNCIDHYQASPTRYDPQLRNDVRPSQASKGPKVPVVRVFGSTETGQKVCAHVHGAFPYLYVEYKGSLAQEQVGAFTYRLHLSIDHALAVSYRRDQHSDNAKFVARITLVKGIPFYGFHVGYRFYLKVYMFNPVVMTRLADLLQQGVIMKQKFQPYEAHLQYLLQFMVDYNLYGCDYLESSRTLFRAPVPQHDQGSNSSHLWHNLSIPSASITDDASLPRASHCSIEVDICVQNIVNRKMVKERQLHHDFVERLSPLRADQKLVYSMAGLWRDEMKRRKRQMPRAQQGDSPFPPEALVSMSANVRDSQPQGWIHEAEYRDEVGDLVRQDREGLDGAEPDFATFVQADELEKGVNTALQSVEDLYPSKLKAALGLPPNPSQSNGEPTNSIDVDENRARQVLSDGLDLLPDDSDQELLQELVDGEFFDGAVSGRRATPADRSGSARAGKRTGRRGDESWLCRRFSGIGLSVFQTERLPTMPVSAVLLEAAEDDGLVGRVNATDTLRPFKRASLKRKRSETRDSGSRKESRQELPSMVAGNSTTNSPGSRQLKADGPEAQAGRTSGGHSMKGRTVSPAGPSSSNRALSFAIVKDPLGASSRLQPSQKSQSSLSQRSEEGVQNKPVAPGKMPASTDDDGVGSQLSVSSLSSAKESDTQSQMSKVREALARYSNQPSLIFATPPPSRAECSAMAEHNLPDVIYQDAFYGEEKDVPERMREYGGREFRLESNTMPFLPAFDFAGSRADFGQHLATTKDGRGECSWRSWEFARPPPRRQTVTKWLEDEQQAQETEADRPRRGAWLSQIVGPTPKNKHGFKYTQKQDSTSVEHEVQYMSTLSLELHVNTRGKLVPNAEEDEVQCIFWACKSDEKTFNTQESRNALRSGIIVQTGGDDGMGRMIGQCTRVEVLEEKTELDAIYRLIELVRTLDPDVLTGFEVHGGSWGYMMERARQAYDVNLCDELSRMRWDSHGRFGKDQDGWGFNKTSTIRVTGRHTINIWRAMQNELNLLQYTMENVAWHLLHVRVPHYSWKTLTQWYKSGKAGHVSKLLRYHDTRTRLNVKMLEADEIVARTSEQARLLGVDFFSVFSRGSQFKVESILFRIAKPENLMLVSPSKKQVGGQNALECLPLVMEPQSGFYTSPVVVLDFQSLYPSVMIAYNYCYSTFFGRIRGTSKMGFSDYRRQPGLLSLLHDSINIAPNGIMYVKASVRKSLLAKMLTELLETRVMVKSGMKQDKSDKRLQQLLNHRQLALKLLANVTYGYTSASFSGRMPCSEVADSIVQTGRETLERAVARIHADSSWAAEVVYGDTDSLFVHLPGRTREQAFSIGEEMTRAITASNPRPVKLKFEKVYQPCVLLAKKRYVGYKFETALQKDGIWDAKGIETVRRDGTPAEQMVEEKALRLLFDTSDLSQVKRYFQSQCDKLMRGAVSVQDFCFAREVRLGSYVDSAVPPPGAMVGARRMRADVRAEPQYRERVPYVVVAGPPGSRLADRCVAPEDLLARPHWRLDADYYIAKTLIPPLERIFNLVGASVRQWYDEMPKVRRVLHDHGQGNQTLESYMRSVHCLVCAARFSSSTSTSTSTSTSSSSSSSSLCPACRADTPASILALQTRISTDEGTLLSLLSLCRTCAGLAPLDDVRCDSAACPVFWSRQRAGARLAAARAQTGPALTRLVDEEALLW